MNELTICKMTSMEIAEITGKRHDQILRDIRNESEKLETSGIESNHKFVERERDGLTGKIPYYELSKEGVLQLAARYDAVVRAKLIDLAMKKDEPKQFNIPQSYSEALRLAADLEEQRLLLLPKAEQFDKFMSGENQQNMNTVAKTLGWGRNKLFKELRERNILRFDNTPYQEFIDRGYFVVKEKPIEMSGQIINKPQTYVTPKGVNYISTKLSMQKGA